MSSRVERLGAFGCATVCFLGLTFSLVDAAAQQVVYRWADKNGTIHFSDNLTQVPEPYASLYQARIRELEKERAEKVGKRKTPPPTRPSANQRKQTVAPTPSGIAESRLKQRDAWQNKVAEWRSELELATDALAKIEEEKARLTLNPLLRTTPQTKEQIDAVDTRRAKAIQRLEAAKKMLLDTLPTEAKKAGVPLRWLL